MLFAVLFNHCSSSISKRRKDVFIGLACLAIYGYFNLSKLVVKPVVILLEDQRGKASCERNIKAIFSLIELVCHDFTCKLMLHSKY